MNPRNLASAAALAGVLVIGGATRADDAAPADASPDAGADQLTVPKGHALLDAQLEINLSSGAAGKPVSLAPDLWYGVTDDLTVGLVHSQLGQVGFMGGIADSLCLAGSSNGCPHVYNDVGVDLRYGLKKGTMAWAFDGGVYARDVDPFQLAIKLGIDGRWHKGKVALEFAPNVALGLTNRSPMIGVHNEEELYVPVTGQYAIASKVAVLLQVGLFLPFESAGDTWALPVSIGLRAQATPKLGLGVAFSLPDLAGGSAVDTGADARSLTIGGDYAF